MQLDVTRPVRLKYTTGVAHRMISSAAEFNELVGMRAQARHLGRVLHRASIPCEIAVRVVSFPATASARMNISNSCAPSTSSSTW